MPDPQAARITQLRNIQAKTGRSIAELHETIAATGLVKVGERRAWAMGQFNLGYGDANALALWMGQPLPDLGDAPASAAAPVTPAAPADDPLDAIYTGPKADLRPLHDALMSKIAGLGSFDIAPKKGYISLRRKKQFAMLGPATQDLIELGLNAKNLPAHPRLKALPAGGMCQYTVRLGHLDEVDGTLLGWVRSAYEAAG